MARRNRTGAGANREARGHQQTAVKLLGLGLVLVILPFLLGSSPLGHGLKMATPVGFLLIAGAGIYFWLNRSGSIPKLTREAFGQADRSPKVSGQLLDPLPPPGTYRSVADQVAASSLVDEASTSVRPTAWSRDVFDVIEWRRFEALVEAMYKMAGFATRSQPHGADGGVDVWVYAPEKTDTPLSVVQCKHWLGSKVGVDKIRELLGVMTANNVKRGQLATTSTFSDEAKQFAQANGIHLLDVHGLLELIAKRTLEQQGALLDVALEGEYWRPTCVNCGTKMVERTPKSGGNAFWGCANYPRCKTTMRKKGRHQ